MEWERLRPGPLTDDCIRANQARLIPEGYEEKQVQGVCYDLRVGAVAHYPYLADASKRRLDIEEGSGVYLPSHAYVVVMTEEQISVPDDCVCRILAKGQLFALGISAVCTYADPGFQGHLGITLLNNSARPIFLKRLSPFAKIEFEKLVEPVSRPYLGRHRDTQDLWPVKDDYFQIPDPCKRLDRDPKPTNTTERLACWVVLPICLVSSIAFWVENPEVLKKWYIWVVGVLAVLAAKYEIVAGCAKWFVRRIKGTGAK